MARAAKPVPAGFEENVTTKKLRCLTCKDGDPTNNGKWIEKKSVPGHLESSLHLAHAQHKKQRDQEAALKAQRLQQAYSGPSMHPIQSGSNANVSSAPRAEMYHDDGGRSPSPGWTDYAAAGLNAPVIPSFMTCAVEDRELEQERLKQQVAQMLAQSEDDDEDDTLDNTINALKDLDLDNEGDEINEETYFSNVPISHDYAPYPDKVSMLLDILDNLPRLRMSSNQLKMILWLLKECRIVNVLHMRPFEKMQDRLRGLCGSEPKAYTSGMGNRFFVNDVRDSISRDFSNPEIVKHLNFYPEETTGPVSEVWQVERWKEFKPSELTPMYARGLRQFYIEEVAELESGKKVIPLTWIKRGGVLCADCLDVIPAITGWQIGQDVYSIVATEFKFNYHDITERVGAEIKWAVSSNAPEMPNPLRVIAGGDDLYVVMVPMWADNVSGNKSKQYNKHMNMYMANSNLPGRLLQQEYFVRFVSTSPHASSPSSFPQLRNRSKEASHMGGNANCGCRRCKAGGPHDHTESDEGYHSVHYAGLPRFAAQTKHNLELETQIKLAMYGVEAPISKLQTATGVKDKVAQYWIDILLEKARQMKADNPGHSPASIADDLQKWLDEQPGDKVNPLLDIAGLDPNHDTPVELLHTILLGIIKYVWHILHTTWTEAERNLFVIRLQSTNINELTIPPIRAAYMMQYKNGLIGKHFKTLMQTMVFHMHGLVSPEIFRLVKAVSALGSVLWVHEIDNVKEYAEHLTILIGNVLDAFGDHDPAKILLKVKLHLLTHMVEDIFECFNAIFRLCSILSNHQAPSRDIAHKFASMDRLKHILSGGFWKQGNEWVQAATNVCDVLHTMPIIQRHLGWVPLKKIINGAMHFTSKEKSPAIRWKDTQSASASNALANCRSVYWHCALTVTAQSGDTCSQGTWIFARNSENVLIIGRILELLTQVGDAPGVPTGLVTLEHFLVSEQLHLDYDMPVLQRPPEPHLRTITVLSDAILFYFSVQHDCRLADFQPTALRRVVQERQETSQTAALIAHTDDDHFCINMAAIHNATLVRRTLPIALTVPRPIYLDRKAYHYGFATHLRVSQTMKRARTQEKRKATLAAKAAKKGIAKEIGIEDDAGEDSEEDDPPVVSQKRKRAKRI
ncbi:hypothetical protein B0H13DRAFT_2255356 [Mycena leptocephala]|nr:hypothetical protein B0H13DRAFT_2255356 [Mycena leptocephala]